jgi:hypothetical protein
MSSIDNPRTPNRKLLKLGIFDHTLGLKATCMKQVTFFVPIFSILREKKTDTAMGAHASKTC